MRVTAALYRGVTALIEPAAPAVLALRARDEGGSLREERLGKRPDRRVDTWWHAASLGEVAALEPVLTRAIERGQAGEFLVTTSTVAGRRAAERRWPGRAALAPLDLPGAVGRALRTRRPEALILVETELWPNWLRAAGREGTRIAVVNGRVSDRSWPRYRRWRGALADGLAAVRALAARTALDAERFVALGARPETVRVTGNTKHDRLVPPAPARLPWNGVPVWTAGSLRSGEEEIVLDAFARVRRDHPELRLVLAPRHPRGWEDLLARLAARGIAAAVRSRPAPEDAVADALILDTQGELAAVYASSSVALVGGTLVPVGGHNVMEAAAAGIPVLVGPHRANVVEDAEALIAAGGAIEVADAAGVASALAGWLADPGAGRTAGDRARDVARRGEGAAGRALDWLTERVVLRGDDHARG
jgi:3-deoxy-D-manno-octulosonic-acid transferase